MTKHTDAEIDANPAGEEMASYLNLATHLRSSNREVEQTYYQAPMIAALSLERSSKLQAVKSLVPKEPNVEYCDRFDRDDGGEYGSIDFYTTVLAFIKTGDRQITGVKSDDVSSLQADPIPSAANLQLRIVTLQLGAETIELTQCLKHPGRPIPPDSRSNDIAAVKVRISSLTASAGVGIELLEYREPTDGRSIPTDTESNDLWYCQTKIVVTDAMETVQQLTAAQFPLISTEVSLSNKFTL